MEQVKQEGWFAIDGHAYDLSKFARLHPGGRVVLEKHAGTEVSDLYKTFHNDGVLRKYHRKLAVGRIAGDKAKASAAAAAARQPDSLDWYGDTLAQPYYRESHRRWHKKVNGFVDEHIIPRVWELAELARPDPELLLKMGAAGILAAACGPPWPRAYLDAAVEEPEGYDWLHFHITHDALARCGVSSVIAAYTNGPSIACSAIKNFGTEEQRKRYLTEVFAGRKLIALAISEAQAGSDVAGLTCEAKVVGDHYEINGSKKWITNGAYADYFAVLARTGGRGDLSFIAVERGTEGFSTRKIRIRASDASGTAYLNFYQCKVPRGNLIGRTGQGFKMCMYSFNSERQMVSSCALRLARICLDESVRYASRRYAFNKPLTEQQAIRMQLVQTYARLSQMSAWLESTYYKMTTMTVPEANAKLGDVIALIKAEAGQAYSEAAQMTTHVFGGNALWQDGPGRLIEHAVMTAKGYQIPAGAVMVMHDYAARQMVRRYKAASKL